MYERHASLPRVLDRARTWHYRALPPALRKRYHLDQPGAQVELTERDDGVIEMRPAVAVPATEAWFWDERWQAGEREVDEHVARGEETTHESAHDFLAHLDTLDA